MEKERFDCYKEEATTSRSLQMMFKRLLIDLNRFLSDFSKDSPELLDKLVKTLQDKLRESITKEFSVDLSEINVGFDILADYPQLVNLTKDAMLSLLSFDKYAAISFDKNADYLYTDALRSNLFPRYYMAASLATTLSRNKALAFYRDYIDRYAEQYVGPSWRFDTLEEFAEKMRTEWPASATHSITLFRPHEGTLGAKIEKCLWYHVMKELDDPELAYYVACYGDFQMAKFYNENFVLTRTQTLMEGKNYCDFCWHDTRITKQNQHPLKAFWDNL